MFEHLSQLEIDALAKKFSDQSKRLQASTAEIEQFINTVLNSLSDEDRKIVEKSMEKRSIEIKQLLNEYGNKNEIK